MKTKLEVFQCGCTRVVGKLFADVPLPLPRCAVYLQAWPGAHEDWSRWMAFLKEHFNEGNRIREGENASHQTQVDGGQEEV